MGRHLTLIVVPHDDAQTRNYHISYRLLYTFVSLTVLFLLAILFFVASYGQVAIRASKAARLERENSQLLARTAQIDSLKHELLQVQAMSIQIKKMMGIDLTRGDSLVVAKLSAIARYPAISDEENPFDMNKSEQRRVLKATPTMWPVKGYVTREFYTTGGEKSSKYHPGIDIAAKSNIPVLAPADGLVVTSTWDDVYGNMIVIDHGFGISTMYGHNARNMVKKGDRVTKGQVIAFVGNTGRSSAPHLHFEVRKNGLSVNPRKYLLE